MIFNRWWEQDLSQIFWMEITDRSNLGEDLNAPRARDDGQEFWGYSLIQEIADGDVIFHYHKDAKAILAWSRASGSIWEDTVFWGAHGTAARAAGVEPYLRPGWRLGLEDFSPLAEHISLSQLRDREAELRAIHDQLVAIHGATLYFPFHFYPGSLRPAQGYLVKLPAELVALYASLTTAAEAASNAHAIAKQPGVVDPGDAMDGEKLGATYRREDENVAAGKRDPGEVDPALVERALKGHKKTQNQLADTVLDNGLEPRSHKPGEPNFDLAWVSGGAAFVAEVKSITDENEEKQLRLGLGQVLRYGHLMGIRFPEKQIIPVLVAERQPSDPSWLQLCSERNVKLVWPSSMATLFG